MTPHLTVPSKELDRLIRQTPPQSMMFWAGTCADPAATCGGCQHYGYESVTRNKAGDAVETHKHPASCALYKKHHWAGRDGKPFDPATRACKYFAAKGGSDAGRP
jgi:hypothetical protein